MPSFIPVNPPRDPKDCAPWLFEALRRLNKAAATSTTGLSAVLRGEAPDGSGGPLLDTSQFFYLPGRVGGQTGHGGVGAAEDLTLVSTRHDSKGHIYFGTARTTAFDETNQRLGLNIAAPLARLHQYHSAAELMQRWEMPGAGPIVCTTNGTTTVTSAALFANVSIGMLVSGGGATPGTTVTARASDSSITVSIAIPTGTPTLTFNNRLDLTAVEGGFTGSSALQIIIGGGGVAPSIASGLRLAISGDGRPANSAVRQFIQAGPTNLNFSFTGHFAATGNSTHFLFSYFSFNTWGGINTALTNAARVGINTDPFDYSSSAAGSQPDSLIVARRTGATAGVPSLLVEAASSTQMAIAVRAASAGTAPSRTISGSNLAGFRHDGDMILANSGTLRGLMSGLQSGGSGTTTFNIRETANSLQVLAGGKVGAWSDSLSEAQSTYFMLGDSSGGHLATAFCTPGFGIATRIGFSTSYLLISNGQIGGGSSSFLGPEATPVLLRLQNTTTLGTDATRLLMIQTQRSGQTGDLVILVGSAGVSSPLSGFDYKGRLYQNDLGAGYGVTDKNVSVDGDGNVLTYNGELVIVQ